jgi:putative transposase
VGRGLHLCRDLAGVQYTSIALGAQLIQAEIRPSIGSVGDSYDNALAETTIGLFKTEVIRWQGPRRNRDAVEMATLEWVDWYNNRRLFRPWATSHRPRENRPTRPP